MEGKVGSDGEGGAAEQRRSEGGQELNGSGCRMQFAL